MLRHAQTEVPNDRRNVAWTLPSREEIDRLRAHPRFFEAARTMGGNLAEMYQGNRALSVLLSDRARTQMAYVALYMHWTKRLVAGPSGITASELKAICVRNNFCSASRAEVMIAAMRLFGFAKVVKDPYDKRVKLLVPTEKHILMQMARWRKQFTVMTMIMPQAEGWLAALDRPDFPPELVRQLCESYFDGIRIVDNAPVLVPLMDHNCGMPILLHLTAGSERAATTPPSLTARLSISGLARRFNVSRTHVRNVLRTAETLGLVKGLSDENHSSIVLTTDWIDAFEDMYATTFLHLAECATKATAMIGPARTNA